MAKAKTIVKRRKAVTNIRKITRTMQLIATSKFQKAQYRAVAAQPYTRGISELVNQVAPHAGEVQHPLLKVNRKTGRTALLVITSNRGLCGGYNARILETGLNHLRSVPDNQEVQLDVAGKKGIAYFRFMGRTLHHRYSQFDDRVRFEDVEHLANEYIDQYVEQQLDAVHVAYMHFASASRQAPTLLQLLPLRRQALAGSGAGEERIGEQYEFSPPPAELLAELLPATVRTNLFQCFIDAGVSEQIYRMVAMKAATDAATDMIKILTRTYNRARQSQITLELLDILGGAEALVR